MQELKNLKIAIASDHAGFQLKGEIIKHLEGTGCKIVDMGTHSEESCSYAIHAHQLSIEVASEICNYGIAICGSGNGISMTCNKHHDIRCAICWDIEIAQLARAHNNANICALPARFISTEKALAIVDTFFSTNFEAGRHQVRVDMINNY